MTDDHELESARRTYDARMRSAWEQDYAGAIKAASRDRAARLIDLLRAERPLTTDDFQRLADYLHYLHRKPGKERDETVHDVALQAEALLDVVRSVTGRSNIRNGERQRIYYYIVGLDPEKADHPEKLDDADDDKLKLVERVAEHIRKGRHLE
jgi:hypothetical protein